jgi:phosphoribosyl 1,2-cyclic phosphate phosphodiesterase
MKIEFLGSGGAITTPRPGCFCAICEEARAKGIPYSRSGPGLFIHDLKLLIDTSEDIKLQLNRARVAQVDACIYSHWHPDHTLGARVWEMNADWRRWPPQSRRSTIYVPQQVALDFRERLGMWDQLMYWQEHAMITVQKVPDGDVITLGGARIRPFRVAEAYVYAFLLEQGDTRVLIAPDELVGWQPPAEVHGVDLAIIPAGLFEFNPFSGARHIPADHPVLKFEATFRQTLDMVRQMAPRRVIMTHLEEPMDLNYDDYVRLATKLQAEGYPITFAYDTLIIEV